MGGISMRTKKRRPLRSPAADFSSPRVPARRADDIERAKLDSPLGRRTFAAVAWMLAVSTGFLGVTSLGVGFFVSRAFVSREVRPARESLPVSGAASERREPAPGKPRTSSKSEI